MEDLKHVLHSHYGLSNPEISALEGYANPNYRVVMPDGSQYVLKKYAGRQGLAEVLQAECEVLEAVSRQLPGRFPEPVKTLDQAYLVYPEEQGDAFYRLLRWVNGDFLYAVQNTPAMLGSLGSLLAKLDLELMKEHQPALMGRKIDWDLQHLPALRYKLELIGSKELKRTVHYFLLQFQEEVMPVLPHLRHSLIHNDANDWNILVGKGRVNGIIDFGDMVYGPLIQELAVCLTYALFEKDDPLKWAVYVVKEYHRELPLEKRELDILYYLIAGRLCMSLLNAAASTAEDPTNEYLGVSEQQAITLINQWLAINPARAASEFRMACNLEPERQAPVSESLEKRGLFISTAQSVSYNDPVKMQRAAFQYMYDAFGNTFLDAYNNIPHVGHQHPRVVEAGQRQMARLNTNTRYLYDQLADYAEKLLDKFPPSLSKVFFVNSGSAASDLAIRMAQTHTGHDKVMVLDHGYHGNTRLGIDISHYKFGGKGGKGQANYIIRTPLPDTYRGAFTEEESAGRDYASLAQELIVQSSGPIAAFIAEPIVGCAGQVPLARDYLKNIYPMIRKQGGLCISDEVQTGFGRVGSGFWGYELQDVVPDIVVLGKPMGNGHPIAAVVTTDEIARSFDNGMEFFSSFGGNPVSCAIGMAVLDVIEEEGLQDNALRTGNHFMQLLRQLMMKYEEIGDVRGHGLFIGVEFVTDRTSKIHNGKLAGLVKNMLRDRFILVSTDGPENNIIKMKPPLCFTVENANAVVEQMDKIMELVR